MPASARDHSLLLLLLPEWVTIPTPDPCFTAVLSFEIYHMRVSLHLTARETQGTSTCRSGDDCGTSMLVYM